MGKYFSNDTNFSNYDITNDNSVDATKAIPSTDNLTAPLSDETKEKLSRTPNEAVNEDDYINLVKEQTEQVSSMIQQYSDESKQELKNQFQKFQPVEIFEKLNQIIFVIAQLGNKITSLEKTLNTIMTNNADEPDDKNENNNDMNIDEHNETENDIPQSIPNTNQTSDDMPTVNEIKQKINMAKNGNKDNDTYTDKSVKLEEIFPNLDDEAYQAAYASSMLKERNKPKTEEKTPSPGKMRGITGF